MIITVVVNKEAKQLFIWDTSPHLRVEFNYKRRKTLCKQGFSHFKQISKVFYKTVYSTPPIITEVYSKKSIPNYFSQTASRNTYTVESRFLFKWLALHLKRLCFRPPHGKKSQTIIVQTELSASSSRLAHLARRDSGLHRAISTTGETVCLVRTSKYFDIERTGVMLTQCSDFYSASW